MTTTAWVITILAGGYLFYAFCKAVREAFREAAWSQKQILADFDAERENALLSVENGEKLQRFWEDPRSSVTFAAHDLEAIELLKTNPDEFFRRSREHK